MHRLKFVRLWCHSEFTFCTMPMFHLIALQCSHSKQHSTLSVSPEVKDPPLFIFINTRVHKLLLSTNIITRRNLGYTMSYRIGKQDG